MTDRQRFILETAQRIEDGYDALPCVTDIRRHAWEAVHAQQTHGKTSDRAFTQLVNEIVDAILDARQRRLIRYENEALKAMTL
jgi:hypothetical protein